MAADAALRAEAYRLRIYDDVAAKGIPNIPQKVFSHFSFNLYFLLCPKPRVSTLFS